MKNNLPVKTLFNFNRSFHSNFSEKNVILRQKIHSFSPKLRHAQVSASNFSLGTSTNSQLSPPHLLLPQQEQNTPLSSLRRCLLQTLRLHLSSKMSNPAPSSLGICGPPPGIKGMTKLDRDAFSFKALFPALEIDVSWLTTLMKVLKNVRFKHKNVDTILNLEEGREEGTEDPVSPDRNGQKPVCEKQESSSPSSLSSSKRYLLLDPEIAPDHVTLVSFLNTKASCLDQFGITENNFSYRIIQLNYDHFNAETVRYKRVCSTDENFLN